jgi:hypothetical protein
VRDLNTLDGASYLTLIDYLVDPYVIIFYTTSNNGVAGGTSPRLQQLINQALKIKAAYLHCTSIIDLSVSALNWTIA